MLLKYYSRCFSLKFHPNFIQIRVFSNCYYLKQKVSPHWLNVPVLLVIRSLSEKVGKEIVKRDDKRAKGKKLESEIGDFGVGQRKEVPNQRRSRCDNRTEEGIEMLWLQAQENNGNGV